MGVTLTSDPIVDEQLVLEMLKISGDKARSYINSVSSMFLSFTRRRRITSGTVTERHVAPPPHMPVLWLRAVPVTSISSVVIYSQGTVSQTLATSDYVINTDTGRLSFVGEVPGYLSAEQVVHVSYVGGWSSVPGDIQQTALEMIRLQHARLEGRVGVTSESREGHSASYEQRALPQSVTDVWNAHKVYQ